MAERRLIHPPVLTFYIEDSSLRICKVLSFIVNIYIAEKAVAVAAGRVVR